MPKIEKTLKIESGVNDVNDVDLLDLVKIKFGFHADAQLAESIGTQKQTISAIRAGTRPLPVFHKLICIDKLGYAWPRESLLCLFPRKYAQWLRNQTMPDY